MRSSRSSSGWLPARRMQWMPSQPKTTPGILRGAARFIGTPGEACAAGDLFRRCQWMDDVSLDGLHFLKPRLALLPVLILLARRSESSQPASAIIRNQLFDLAGGKIAERP